MRRLSECIFGGSPVYRSEVFRDHEFHHLFVVEYAEESQYDHVVELCRSDVNLPHGVLCLAGSGGRFHGQRNREWDSPPGNLYLTAYFAPNRAIDRFGPGFVILPAVSVIGTIDSIASLAGRARTKWVNDILMDGAKVAGVLTYSQAMGNNVTGVVLGIGLNVETSPQIVSQRFVPKVACLRDFVPDKTDCNLPSVFENLIARLSDDYRILARDGYRELLEVYRDRSAIIGRRVTICADDPDGDSGLVVSGIVESIGESLELRLEGRQEPVSRGRLVLDE